MNKLKKDSETQWRETLLRILFVIGVIGLYIVISYYDCIALKLFSPTRLFIENGRDKTYALLFGSGICNSCSTGKYVSSVSENANVVFVVPEDYTDTDIENFRDTFSLKGKIIKGDSRISSLVDHIVACKQFKKGQRNILVSLSKDNKINFIRHL